ncbi:MAG: glycosyltransferase family 2 protein [Methylacidiphilales bacterium]|nr:glycosyltransferase family 2 protein [Candidatus Methylacidiphilales bacterium]
MSNEQQAELSRERGAGVGTNPDPKPLQMLSIVIPARDEEGCIESTVEHLHLELKLNGVPHEIVVVDDGSSDRTWEILIKAGDRMPELRAVKNEGRHGFGCAIQKGLDVMTGDAVVIMMADESDDCRDVVRYWQKLNEDYDYVFGSRFMKGGASSIIRGSSICSTAWPTSLSASFLPFV